MNPEASADHSSPFLRYFAIVASLQDNDLDVNLNKMKIMLFPDWIVEGRNQEEIHERYTNATAFIMAVISRKIEEKREEDPDNPIIAEYDELNGELGTCDVVMVTDQKIDSGDEIYFKMTTHMSAVKDETANPGASHGRLGMVPLTQGAGNDCTESLFDSAREEARENGFRRVNCTARTNFRRALTLAYRVGYLDPEESLTITARRPRSEDIEDDIKMYRGGRDRVKDNATA